MTERVSMLSASSQYAISASVVTRSSNHRITYKTVATDLGSNFFFCDHDSRGWQWISSTRLRLYYNGSNRLNFDFAAPVTVDDEVEIVATVTQNGATWDVSVSIGLNGGAPVASTSNPLNTSVFSGNNEFVFNSRGEAQSIFHNQEFISCLYEDLDNSANNQFWSAAASGGTGLSIPETLLSNNATLNGYNPPDDNSQWLGFGGGSGTLTIVTPEYRFWQRVGSSATVEISGTYTGTPTTIERSVDGGAYVTAIASPSGGAFVDSFSLATGTHSITYRFSNEAGVLDSVNNIGVGICIPPAGQSNASGRGTNNQTYSNSTGGNGGHLFGNDDQWKILADPYDSSTDQVDAISIDSAAGSWLPRFANSWLAENEVPICYIPCAKGATAIAEWQKDSTDRIDGLNLYESMSRRINAVGGCEVVFYQQGERDSRTTVATTLAEYRDALIQFALDVFTDFGVRTFVVPLQTITDPDYTNQSVIRQAQIDAAAASPYIDIGQSLADIDLSGGDGLHFKTDTELNTVATRMYSSYTSINVVGATPNVTYSAVNGSVELGAVINIVGQTPNYSYAAVPGSVFFAGEILITGQTPNYSYSAVRASVQVGDPDFAVNFSGTIKTQSFNGIINQSSFNGVRK